MSFKAPSNAHCASPSFYGITILQTVIYYKQYPNDPWLFRYSVREIIRFDGIFLTNKQVAILWCAYRKLYKITSWILTSTIISRILDTLHVAISTHALYFYMIESFGNYLPLFGIIWYVSSIALSSTEFVTR